MNTTLPSSRIFPAVVLSAILAVGLIMPLLGFAELSNDTLLGPGLRLRPTYDGSATQRFELVPVVRYFGQPWFLRSTQGVLEGGVRMELAPGLHIGAQLAYESGRESSESDFLNDHHVSDISPGASIGAHLEWDLKIGPMPITLVGRARQNIDFDRGAQVDFRLSFGIFQYRRFSAGLVTQAIWADAKSTRSYYAVTPEQSSATGLPAFDAGNGLLSGSLGLLWSFDLARNWVVVGNLEVRSLYGDAARSPITERSTNYFMTVGLAYRF